MRRLAHEDELTQAHTFVTRDQDILAVAASVAGNI